MNWKLIGKKKKGILLHRKFSSMPAQLAHEASPHPPPSLPLLPSGPCALEWPTGQRPLSLHEPSCQGFSLKSTSPAHHMSPSGQNSRCCMPYPITSQLPPMPRYCMRMLQPSCHTAVQSPHTAALCARAILPPGVAMPGAEGSATSNSACPLMAPCGHLMPLHQCTHYRYREQAAQ
jgi:hypothetical protein